VDFDQPPVVRVSHDRQDLELVRHWRRFPQAPEASVTSPPSEVSGRLRVGR
jgi:hypothetical protein